MEPIMAPNLLERRRPGEEPDRLKWLCYAGMLALSFFVFYAIVRRPSSDLSMHATWAGEIDFLAPRTLFRHGAHPLWHVLVALLNLTGLPLKMAAAWVTALLKLAELALLHRLFTAYLRGRVNRNLITLLAVVCAVVSSLCVPGYNPEVYVGGGTPNTWHSPTQMIAMVAMLLCVPYTACCYAEFERLRPLMGPRAVVPAKKALTLSGLLLVSLLAKPTVMQAFLPAACLFFGVQWIRRKENSRFFLQMLLAALPAVLFMVVQYLYYFMGVIIPPQGGVTVQLSLGKLGEVCLMALLLAAFPLYALIAFRRPGRWKDPLFSLTALFAAMGFLEYLLLGETGRRAMDGNFGWGMMGASLMLWAVALADLGLNWAEYRRSGAPKRAVSKFLSAGMLLLWHLFSGIYYIVYLLTTTHAL